MFNDELCQPTPELLQELADNMAQADIDEVWAGSHSTPIQALVNSVLSSAEAYVWVVDGSPKAAFGVSKPTVLSNVGVPWMLGAKDLPKYGKKFARGSKVFTQEWLEKYGVLRNAVDARHKVAVHWIKWMGFTVYPAIPFGPDKVPFHPFKMEK